MKIKAKHKAKKTIDDVLRHVLNDIVRKSL